MKQLSYLLCLVLGISILSCKSTQSPGDVAISFMKSLESGDFESANEFASDGTKDLLNMFSNPLLKHEFKKSLKQSKTNFTYEVIDTKIDGDKAICTMKMADEVSDEQVQNIELVKKDGKWLVDMNKEDMMQNGMDKEDLNKEDMNKDTDDQNDQMNQKESI